MFEWYWPSQVVLIRGTANIVTEHEWSYENKSWKIFIPRNYTSLCTGWYIDMISLEWRYTCHSTISRLLQIWTGTHKSFSLSNLHQCLQPRITDTDTGPAPEILDYGSMEIDWCGSNPMCTSSSNVSTLRLRLRIFTLSGRRGHPRGSCTNELAVTTWCKLKLQKIHLRTENHSWLQHTRPFWEFSNIFGELRREHSPGITEEWKLRP